MNTTRKEFLAKEWHPDKNVCSILELSDSSSKKVWWRCSNDGRHEWETRFFARNQNGQDCPFCVGKRVLLEDSVAGKFDKLLEEWDYDKNKNLDPKELACKSGKKVWWKCKKGHGWEAIIRHRTSGGRNGKGTGCPYCSNHRISNNNSLGNLFPDLIKEWHSKNKETVFSIVAGSHKKVWWKCNKAEDHEWIASPSERTVMKSGCPCCVGRKVVLSNCLATTHPQIVKEWHPIKNSFAPTTVTHASNKKAWFVCLNDKTHQWNCKIYSRTRGDQCPFCSSSKGEKIVRNWLTDNGFKFIEQYRINECRNIRPLPFDFAVNIEGNIYLIEYQGIHHYEPRKYFGGLSYFQKILTHDKIKLEYCQNNNIPLLLLSCRENSNIDNLLYDFCKV